jgi:hypothetical protein
MAVAGKFLLVHNTDRLLKTLLWNLWLWHKRVSEQSRDALDIVLNSKKIHQPAFWCKSESNIGELYRLERFIKTRRLRGKTRNPEKSFLL